MSLLNSKGVSHKGSLTLADGNSWTIGASDESGAFIADKLLKTMQLKPSNISGPKLLITKNRKYAGTKVDFLSSCVKNEKTIRNKRSTFCQLNPAKNKDDLAVQMMKVSLFFCSQAETLGGVLIHGGLAVKDGAGIILAGPGDIGKTTASRRLKFPWKSLSDDCTLIVKDKKGTYRAHPWPTWSDFMFGGQGGSWDVQKSIPLKAVYLLSRNDKDYVEPVGEGQAACMLNESADQAWLALANDFEDDEQRKAMNIQRFNNICEMVKKVPVHLLHISRNGSFWEKIEKSLELNG